MNFTILGRTGVRVAGGFKTGVSKPWLIMAALLALPGKQLSFRDLINWVWAEDEEQPENIQRTFHTYTNRIRREIIGRLDNVELVAANGTLRLMIDRMQIDYHRFRGLIDKARQTAELGDVAGARDVVLQAMELWSGPPLAELHTDHADSWRRNATDNHWVPANTLLVKLHLDLGEPERAIAVLDDVQDEFPDNIALGKYRFMALSQLGRRSDAADYAGSMRRRLKANGDDEGAAELARLRAAVWRDGARPAPRRSEVDSRPPPLLVLPHAVPDFVGRRGLLDQLDKAAVDENGRLRPTVVCLVGASGVGKTAAVTFWARMRHERHGDSAILVNLHGFGDTPMLRPAAVVDELLRELGYPFDRIDSDSGRAAKLRGLLADRRISVVLDNARDEDHVRPLLSLLSTSLVLITTRQRLPGLLREGARDLTVPLLMTRDATELLTQRVGERAGTDPESTARLARLCGGLPIVLVLVAAQVAAHEETAIGDFVERFRDPAALLSLGEDDGTDTSPATAFAASYRALGAAEQRLFRRLGLHPGPDIGLPAAAALAGLPVAECRRLLAKLAAIHLLEHGPTLDRWHLHDLFRAYAASLAEQADSPDERRAVHRRLLDFYLHSAHAADRMVLGHRASVPMLPLPADVVPVAHADERAAVRWCADERANLMAVIGIAGDFPAHRWRFPHVIIGIFKRSGFRSDLRIALAHGIDAARELGETEAEAATLNDAALLELEAGRLDAARDHFRQAARLARSQHGVATSLCNLARLEIADGRIDVGIRHYRDALAMAAKMSNTHMSARITRSLGDLDRARRRFATAHMHYHNAIGLYESIGHREGSIETYVGLATLYAERGVRKNDRDVARKFAADAVRLADDGVVDPEIEQRARAVFADALLRVGDPAGAVEQAGRAVELARRTHAADREVAALISQARALRATGDLDRAKAAWRECAVICRDRNDAARLAIAERQLAELAVLEEDVTQSSENES